MKEILSDALTFLFVASTVFGLTMMAMYDPTVLAAVLFVTWERWEL